MKNWKFGLALCFVCCCAAAQTTQLVMPDYVGSIERGRQAAQERQERQLLIQQAQQDLQQQQLYQAKQQQSEADQREVRRLSEQLMAANSDQMRWALVTRIAAIDPNLAVQYVQALHLQQPTQGNNQ